VIILGSIITNNSYCLGKVTGYDKTTAINYDKTIAANNEEHVVVLFACERRISY
jgi:hypothetical protein